MPTFEIEDSVSGRRMVIEGDAPPTEQDAAELFASIGDSSPVLNQHKTIGQRLGFGAPVPEGVDPGVWSAFGSDKAIQPGSVAAGVQDFMHPDNWFNPVNYLRQIPKAVEYALRGVDTAAAGVGNLLFDRAHGLPNMVLQGLGRTGFPKEQMVFGSPEYAEGRATPVPKLFEAGRPVVSARLPNADVDPVARALSDIAGGLTTPGNLATLPLLPSKGVQAAFLTQTVPGAAQAGANAVMAPNMDEALEQGVHAIVNAAFSAGLSQGMNKGRTPEGIKPTETRFSTGDLDQIEGRVPPERQLSERVPEQPSFDRPAGAASFAVDPLGQAANLEALSPGEQRELFRGPKEHVPRESYVRPAQQSPVILGKQTQPLAAQELTLGQFPLIQKAYQTAGEPKQGGQISFASEAAAGGIPSARQAGLRMAEASPEIGQGGEIISPEGQHSGKAIARPLIELESSQPQPLNPGGSQASLSPELQALSKKNNSREAFEALQREADAKKQKAIQDSGNLYLNPLGPIIRQTAKDIGDLTKKVYAKAIGAKDWSIPAKGVPLTDYEMGSSSAGHPTLRFRDYETEKKIATSPQGIGRWYGFGPALDPRATAKEPVMKAILTGQSMRSKASQIATLFLEETKVNPRAFLADKDGKVTTATGAKGYMGDLIEAELANPNSQGLTPEQKQFVAEWKVIRQNLVDYARAEGVRKFTDEDGNIISLDENYFPRPAYGKEGVKATAPIGQGGPGTVPFSMKKRYYESEQAGSAAGIKYEPDAYVRVSKFMEGVYKAIADERLSNDPALQGRPAGQGAAKFLEEGGVHIPLGKGKIFPKDVADQINRYYGQQPHSFTKKLATLNDFLKAVQFTADASAPFNQGLLLLARNPEAWAKATARSYATFADTKQLSKYLAKAENRTAAREFVENGGSIGSLQDFLQGAQKGSIATKIPVAKHIIHRSALSMNTFLSVGKLEMYKALRDTVPKKELAKLVEDVENTLLSGRMEQIGITPGRALAERLVFNAPSYMRAAANVIATAAQGKDGWKTAGRSLTQLAAGLSIMMYAAYKGSEMSDEEIAKRMDPRQTKFLKYPIKLRNGDVVEMGVGNIVLQIVKLGGQVAEVVSGNKEVNPGIQGDPFLRFASYRFSPLVQLGQQIYTGEDAFGRELSKAGAVGRAVTPITAQEALGSEKVGTKAALAAGTFAGLQTNPESYSAAKTRLQNETAMERFGKKYSQLNATQRGSLSEGVEKNLETKKTNMGTKGVEYAIKLAEERQKKLQSSLSESAQKFLTRNGLRAPGVDTVLESRGTKASLTAEEFERFQGEVVKQYERQIQVMDKPWFERLGVADKKRFFESYMTQARTVARNKIRAELGRMQESIATE